MAQITPIDPNESISLAPAKLNQNFENIRAELAAIAAVLKIANTSLELNHKKVADAKGIEAASIILTAASGNFIKGFTDGTTDVFGVSSTGVITAASLSLNVTLDSTFGGGLFKKAVTFEKTTTFSGDVKFAGGGVLTMPTRILTVDPTNIGAAATSPINISGDMNVMLVCDNGGSQFLPSGSDVLIKIDRTTLKENQVVTLRMLKKNSINSMKLWNGSNVEPLFAKIDYNSGISDIAYTVFPEFNTAAQGLAWIQCQYIQVTTGVFRLVILDSNNMTNV